MNARELNKSIGGPREAFAVRNRIAHEMDV
jgi:hypothetical protein